MVKVVPDTSGEREAADIKPTDFVPPIYHIKPDNPWLPLLTRSQIVEIHANFKRFDRDGDGHIEAKEISAVMTNLGMEKSIEECQYLIDDVDKDQNGKIEFDEFVEMMANNMLRSDGKRELDVAFNHLFALCQQAGSTFHIEIDEVGEAGRATKCAVMYVSKQEMRSILMLEGHRPMREGSSELASLDAMLDQLETKTDPANPATVGVSAEDIRALSCWQPPKPPTRAKQRKPEAVAGHAGPLAADQPCDGSLLATARAMPETAAALPEAVGPEVPTEA